MKKDIIYSERYNEMRRFRDYELTTSTWYSALLLAILGFIVSEKLHYKSFLASPLNTNTTIQIVVAIGVILIGSFCVYSVCYVSYRYHELRDYMNTFMEPEYAFTFKPQFKPYQFRFQPRHAIFLTLLILIGTTCFVLFAPSVCKGVIALIASIIPLLCIYVYFYALEKKQENKNKDDKRRIEIEKEKQNKRKN